MEFSNLLQQLHELSHFKWPIFIGIVVLVLAFDLGVLHKKNHEIKAKESLILSGFYFSLGLLFSVFIGLTQSVQSANEYLTGFFIEKTLALDNLFVISLIFRYFVIPRKYQYRVLFWGILGVIVLRGILIGLGAFIVSKFSWVMYLFSVFLIVTGFKMFFLIESEPDISKNPVLKLLNRYFRVTSQLHGEKFFVWLTKNHRKYLYITPLFTCLLLIEFVDLIFAVDSVPAILAITTDPYIVYTSNIFAILGLRALFFAIEVVIERFKYVKYALAVILIFIGSKVFIADFLGLEKFPTWISMTVTIGLIVLGIAYSCYKTRKTK
ncbi:MAG: TerC family protein [Gammaproteobacteria bacterium]